MFERRLKILLVLLAVPVIAVAGRLVQLQVFELSSFQADVEKMFERPPRLLPCVRGSIADYSGRRLAYDTPAWDIAVQYAVMVDDPAARRWMRKQLGLRPEQVTPAQIEASWREIAALTDVPPTDLQREADRVVARVQRMKAHVVEQGGVELVIEEEVSPHPVVRGLDQSQQVAARVALAPYPWVEVVASNTRRYEGGASVAQLVGRVGRVSDKVLQNDPEADDPLACYGPDDDYGVLGAEALGESWLRGRRGRVHEDRQGKPLSPPVEPVNGQDMRLTIDLALQRALYARLAEEVEIRHPTSTGGCAVVLDIPSRQVLAMVSYPSIDPADPTADPRVRPDDELRRPYLFRGVRELYPPGSTVKPMILAAALTEGVVGQWEHIFCMGHLFADQPEHWRCTAPHGPVDPIFAIQHSCNVFFYTIGQRLGVSREAAWMSRFGLGRPCGTGLIEELAGTLPTRKGDGEARQAAIGQGQLSVTPLQAANMIATVAAGAYRPVTVWANDPRPRAAPESVGVPDAAWRLVREGMYRVVNQRGGTAYGRAVLSDPGDCVLLGKTGSAEARALEWYYTCRFPDGSIQEIRAPNSRSILSRYDDDKKPTILGQRKLDEYEETHSWFVGYLAPRRDYLKPVTANDLAVAIVVVIEYAGHGGEVAAPVAADMLESVILRQRGGAAVSSTAGGRR